MGFALFVAVCSNRHLSRLDLYFSYRLKMHSIFFICGSRNVSLNPDVLETEISRALTFESWIYYRRFSYIGSLSV